MLCRNSVILKYGAIAVQSALRRSSSSNCGMHFDLTAEQQQLRNIVRKFAAEEITPVAAEYDKTMEFPSDVIKKAHACGLLNSNIPEIYGGGCVCDGAINARVVLQGFGSPRKALTTSSLQAQSLNAPGFWLFKLYGQVKMAVDAITGSCGARGDTLRLSLGSAARDLPRSSL
ncbi:hypothetical protein RB195_023222 [Necator americanus]|uniref:Acyl-CoA dehydrogenase/oxidase N-terminal domain-containing protein n=1 Tax=Necator americanus TaxID=51031 RepID=A0ABR1EIB5_NECAM